jgi:hypothetical protein
MSQHEKKWDALFCNDPNYDYALTMEISHDDDLVAIMRCQDRRLMVDFMVWPHLPRYLWNG